MSRPTENESLSISTIGYIHTPMVMKFDAPHQPDYTQNQESVIELLPGHNFEQALSDLAGFDYIWLIWWFHRNNAWRPMVLPPRGRKQRRGVFATRSPHRPNPLGITAVKLLKVSGLKLWVGSNDLVDGTPILDIKPYLPNVDAFPDAKTGWIAQVEAEISAPPQYQVSVAPLAQEQLTWIAAHGIDFITRAKELLERDPTPHRTRRITKAWHGQYRIGCGAWRMYFTISEQAVSEKDPSPKNEVKIERITIGYKPAALLTPATDHVIQKDVLLKFEAIWPSSTAETAEP